MKKTAAFKMLTELTMIKNQLGGYMPVQVTRLDETDFMMRMQTTGGITAEHLQHYEDLANKYNARMERAGDYVAFL